MSNLTSSSALARILEGIIPATSIDGHQSEFLPPVHQDDHPPEPAPELTGGIKIVDAETGERLLSAEEARQKAEQRAAVAEIRAASNAGPAVLADQRTIEAKQRAAVVEEELARAKAEIERLRAELEKRS